MYTRAYFRFSQWPFWLAHAPRLIGITRACPPMHSYILGAPPLARFFKKQPTNIRAYPASLLLNMGRTLSLPGLLWSTWQKRRWTRSITFGIKTPPAGSWPAG